MTLLNTLLRQKDYLDDRRRSGEVYLIPTIERCNSFSLALPNKTVFAQVVAARNARAYPDGHAAYIERYNQGLRDGFEQLVEWIKNHADTIDPDASIDEAGSAKRMRVASDRQRRRWASEVFGEIGKKAQVVPEDDAKLYLCGLLDRIPACDRILSIEEFTRLHCVVFNQIDLNRLHQQAPSLDLAEDVTLLSPSPAKARTYLYRTFRTEPYRDTVAKQIETAVADKTPFLLQLGLDFSTVLKALHTAPCERIEPLLIAYRLAPDVVMRAREGAVRAELTYLARKFRIIGSLDRWREMSGRLFVGKGPSSSCQHALHQAIDLHAFGEIQRLAQDIEMRDAVEDGVTPLGRALREGRLICAKTLLDAGAERIDACPARSGDLQMLREMLAPYHISPIWDGAERDAATRRLQMLFAKLSERNMLRASCKDDVTARPAVARIARRSI